MISFLSPAEQSKKTILLNIIIILTDNMSS